MIDEKLDEMLDEYDFSNAVRNPFVSGERRDFTVSVDRRLLDKLEAVSSEKGIPVQMIIRRMLDGYAEWVDTVLPL